MIIADIDDISENCNYVVCSVYQRCGGKAMTEARKSVITKGPKEPEVRTFDGGGGERKESVTGIIKGCSRVVVPVRIVGQGLELHSAGFGSGERNLTLEVRESKGAICVEILLGDETCRVQMKISPYDMVKSPEGQPIRTGHAVRVSGPLAQDVLLDILPP
ncbi:MAG: hypothetical protein ABH833_02280 [Parcubacteria group bacterium]